MRRRLSFSALLGLCVLLVGCPLGTLDNYGAVKGRIVDEQGQSHRGCFAELLYAPNWEVIDSRIFYDGAIEGQEFRVSFSIAPGTNPYKLRVGCSTSEAIFISPVVMLDAPIEPVDLGVIVLPKKPIVAQ